MKLINRKLIISLLALGCASVASADLFKVTQSDYLSSNNQRFSKIEITALQDNITVYGVMDSNGGNCIDEVYSNPLKLAKGQTIDVRMILEERAVFFNPACKKISGVIINSNKGREKQNW